jgi:hypothetical protein
MPDASATIKQEKPEARGAIEIDLDGRSCVDVIIKNKNKFLGTYRLVATRNGRCMLQK